MSESDNFKVMVGFLVFFAFLGLLILLARGESRDAAREAQIACVRDSYEMAKSDGGTPKEYESECLRQYQEDQLRELDRP